MVKSRFFGHRRSHADGMGPDRIYKPPYTPEESMAMLTEGRMVLARTPTERVSFNRSVQNLIVKGWVRETQAGSYPYWPGWSVTREGRLIVAKMAKKAAN
jgi:hypothetical protein